MSRLSEPTSYMAACGRRVQPGQILSGPLFSEPMRVETVRSTGADSLTVGLVGMQTEKFRSVTLTSRDLAGLKIPDPTLTYDGDAPLLNA